MHIVVVCGTNRDGALSRLLAQEVAESYLRLNCTVDLVDMAELPPETLSGSAYQEQPEATAALVQRFLKSDGAVFVVPEYNGSFPGVLKLFVDMLPYPEGFDGRPCAFIGLAAGQFQGLRAVEQFQGVAGYRNAYLFPRRLFIGDSYSKFVDGKLADDELTDRLLEQADGFANFVGQTGEKANGS
ncbi:MAG: NAD(P)H-dependent oxidoreductase [Planctomycetota bacterium]|nr:NAD(P)H-dependent oxidoreductase [Planctomycetota bacterium]